MVKIGSNRDREACMMREDGFGEFGLGRDVGNWKCWRQADSEI